MRSPPRARSRRTELDAETIVRRSLDIAADICVYTNRNVTIETLKALSHGAYQFRPMSADDLPLVRDWLARPHVREWWGDPDEQFGLVSGDMSEPAMEQFIVASVSSEWYRSRRVRRTYAGISAISRLPMTEWNTGFGAQPDGTRGIDQFIGEPDMVGRGHGSAFIRPFIEGLLATARRAS